jgi:hypothetical protein
VVPDQHAAFGINRAIKGKAHGEDVWRDLGIEELLRGASGVDVRGQGAEGEGEMRGTGQTGRVERFGGLLGGRIGPVGPSARSGNLLRARRAGAATGGALRS